MLKNKSQKTNVAKTDVEKFLKDTKLKSYQSIKLPYGLKTPGMDRSNSAELVFKYPIDDKSVLDIGCKYGYFCHEAMKRGANQVVGVEISENNYKIAKKIIEFTNLEIQFQNTDFMLLPESPRYDIVLFLNILHHILNPIQAMKKLSNLANEMVVIEFSAIFDNHTKFTLIQKGLLRLFFMKVPFSYIGNQKYHRVWYFSKDAFINLFVNQMSLFKRIEFEKSPRKRGRFIAYCWK